MQPEEPPPQTIPWLSVLIPVYNVAPYLRQCIDSILPQVTTGVEILLLDDGSTDGSLQICERICAAHAPVRLLRHERNRGLSSARNTLLEASAGCYCWFVDSDDEMLPGAIAALFAIVGEHEPEIILCDYRERGRRLNGFTGPARVLCTDREALVRGIFASRRMYSWNRIARRELWGQDLRFPAGRYFEDIMTTPWLCLRARSFFYMDQPWIMYRMRADSILSAATRNHRSFERRMNDDLAGSLAGFREAAARALPQISIATRLAIANFCARNFTGLAWRLVRARLWKDGWKAVRSQLRHYRGVIEQDSMESFASVAHQPLRELRFRRWIEQMLALWLTSSKSGPD